MCSWSTGEEIGHEPYSFEQVKNVLHISELFVFVQPQQGPFSPLLSVFPGQALDGIMVIV